MIEGPKRPSCAIVELMKTFDRKLLPAWSGGGLGVRAKAEARDSFTNDPDTLAGACPRGCTTVQVTATGVSMTGLSSSLSPQPWPHDR